MSVKWSWLLVLGLTPACSALSPQGPSEVARGEYYSAGRPEFDSFFIVLHEKQVELLSAESEPRAARQDLTSVVGLTPDASDDALGQRLSQELKKLAGQGLRVRLEVPPPSSSTLDASATLHASESSASTPLRDALPRAATRLVRSRDRMLATRAELDKLRVMGISLEGNVDRAFRTDGPWKRDEVRQNLSDGQKVITLMQARAQEVEELAVKLLALVGAVATTDASLGQVSAEPAPETVPSKAPRSSGRPGGKPRPPSAGASAPAVKPTPAPGPPPKRGGEDEAAPKPAPGSAPAEIEP